MKSWMLAIAGLLTLATTADAMTAIDAGLWEKTEAVTLDGAPLPSRPRKICLKAGEASLERLLLITDDEATARGCTREVATAVSGSVKMSMSCPASESEPAVNATMELKFTPTSFEGSGTVAIKAKDGHESKGTSLLSGKRLGDC